MVQKTKKTDQILTFKNLSILSSEIAAITDIDTDNNFDDINNYLPKNF